MAINQQNLTTALAGLETTVNRILARITGVRPVHGPIGPNGQAPLSGNLLANGLASFSGMSGQRAGDVADSGKQAISGLSKMMPDVQATVERAGTFYNATIRAGGGMSRAQMQQATLQGLRGGLTSPGSDANVANYLAMRGMMADTKFGSTYQQTIRSVGSAAKYLNMGNEQAAAAIEGLTSGRGSSNFLNRYGILTGDMATGKEKTQGQIFEEMAQRLTAGQPAATEQETLDSLRRGFLGDELANSGMSADQQAMFAQFMIERSRGNNMDLSDPEAMAQMMDKAKKEGNENPYLPGYDLNTAKTDAMGGAEGQYLTGIKAATKALEGLAKAGGAAASVVGMFNSGTQMFMGDALGQGFMEFVGGVSGLFGGGGQGGDSVVGNASSAKMGAMMMGGGGGGFSHTRGAPIGGDSGTSNASAAAGAPQAFSLIHPVTPAKITAVFGQKKSSYSGDIVWPNGHKGVDYQTKLGQTVYAAADGEVMSTDSGGEFGNYVKLKHDNGMYTFYAHLSSKTVSQGRVKQGQPIGGAGNTGSKSTGVHLHFALSTSASTAGAIDPTPYMNGTASSLGMGTGDPEQSASGAAPSPSGDTSTGGSTEDSSALPAADASKILQVSGSGYTAASGSSPAESVAPYSAGSVASSNSNASAAANPPEGGDGYTGDESSAYISPTGASRLSPKSGSKSKTISGTTNNVTINLTIANASDDEARRFAAMVKKTLETESMMKKMART